MDAGQGFPTQQALRKPAVIAQPGHAPPGDLPDPKTPVEDHENMGNALEHEIQEPGAFQDGFPLLVEFPETLQLVPAMGQNLLLAHRPSAVRGKEETERSKQCAVRSTQRDSPQVTRGRIRTASEAERAVRRGSIDHAPPSALAAGGVHLVPEIDRQTGRSQEADVRRSIERSDDRSTAASSHRQRIENLSPFGQKLRRKDLPKTFHARLLPILIQVLATG